MPNQAKRTRNSQYLGAKLLESNRPGAKQPVTKILTDGLDRDISSPASLST